MSEAKIIPLEDKHVDSIVESLSLAFMDDPITNYFAPDRRKREKVSPWFWRSTLTLGMRWGVVETDENGRSAAIWMPPGSTFIPTHRFMRTPFVQSPFRLGLRGIWRFMRLGAPMESAHKRQMPGPHWYLMTLGVHPDLQGQGVGSALLESGHAHATADDVPCYLETATEYDVAYYSKRGYEEGEKLTVGNLNLVTMIRRPQED